MVVVDRWSLFKGHLCNKTSKSVLKLVAIMDMWFAQVWLYVPQLPIAVWIKLTQRTKKAVEHAWVIKYRIQLVNKAISLVKNRKQKTENRKNKGNM